MTAQIMDGKKLAEKIKEKVKEEVRKLKSVGITPGLAVVLVGDNPASKVYVNRKESSCEEVGIKSQKLIFPETITQEELVKTIRQLNNDSSVHGILVQLPLPKPMNENEVMQTILPEKDVDGFHWVNQGKLYSGIDTLHPNTPRGVIQLIEEAGIPIQGRHAVVLGRSLVVGKPTAMLLLEKGATVTVCHSKTPDLAMHSRQADILVAAVGKPKIVTKEMIKPGSIVIDVGITRTLENKLVGDVDFDSVKEVAGCITPVPGGVGPMTVACLMENAVKACQNQTKMKNENSGMKTGGKPIVVGVIGSTRGTDMQAIIDGIQAKTLNARIGLVVSNKADAFILERARTHQIPCVFIDPKSFSTKEEFDAEVAKKMKEANVELVFLIGYNRIVRKPLLDAYAKRILNIHPSLIPAFVGKFDRDVHEDVLNAGVKVTGATLHIATEDVDAGPILSQESVTIQPTDTPETLKEKVQNVEKRMIVEAIRAYSENRVVWSGSKVWIRP